jgi:hypothetical protein
VIVGQAVIGVGFIMLIPFKKKEFSSPESPIIEMD